MTLFDLLNSRRSVPSRQLGEPGPSPEQLDALIAAAIRVPDHGKMAPWRLLLIRREARQQLGERLAQIHQRNDPSTPDAVIAKDRDELATKIAAGEFEDIDPRNDETPVDLDDDATDE